MKMNQLKAARRCDDDAARTRNEAITSSMMHDASSLCNDDACEASPLEPKLTRAFIDTQTEAHWQPAGRKVVRCDDCLMHQASVTRMPPACVMMRSMMHRSLRDDGA